MHIFHKWEYYGEVYIETFLGASIRHVRNQFRRCSVCGKVQEHWSCMGGSGWETLPVRHTSILNRRIVEGELRKYTGEPLVEN